MTARLEAAVREARRIRRNLVRLRGDKALIGDCGLASILLADAIFDVRSLRHTDDLAGKLCAPHVWNVVDGVIVDITATQFNGCLESSEAGEPGVVGVLVATSRRVYHTPIAGRGRQTLAYLEDTIWPQDQAHRGLVGALRRLRASCRASRGRRASA